MDDHDKELAATLAVVLGSIFGSMILCGAMAAIIGFGWALATVYGPISLGAIIWGAVYLRSKND